MNITQTLTMALKSIGNNKVRSILTMLGIIIGVAAVITLVATIQGIQQAEMMMMQSMGVNRIDLYGYANNSKTVDSILEYCEKEVGKSLVGMTPSSSWSGTVKYRTKTMADTRIYFGNEHYTVCTSNSISVGRDITATDIKNRARVCVIGEALRKNFFGAMSPIGHSIKINGQSYKVIGVYNGKYGGKLNTQDQMLLLPYTQEQRVMGYYNRNSIEYTLRGTDTKSVTQFVEDLTAFAATKIDPNGNNGYFNAYSNDQYQEQSEQQYAMMSAVAGGVAGISLLVGGIGIMNIMLVSVTERTREIGIRMAIGARRRDIVGQFLLEAAVVSACGGIIGIALGFIGSSVLGNLILQQLLNNPWMPEIDMTVSPSVSLVMGSFLFSAVLGVVFGVYPANKASKLQPVEALRTQ